MKKKVYSFKAKVEMFPGESPWYFVAVPEEITSEKELLIKLKNIKGFRFLRINVKVGETTWDTSLLPLGKISPGRKFIAIKKAIRKMEFIQFKDEISVDFFVI